MFTFAELGKDPHEPKIQIGHLQVERPLWERL